MSKLAEDWVGRAPVCFEWDEVPHKCVMISITKSLAWGLAKMLEVNVLTSILDGPVFWIFLYIVASVMIV